MNPLALALLILVLGGVGAPVAIDIAVGDRIYPDSPLYPIERWGERVELTIYVMVNRSAEFMARLAAERADEALHALEANMTDVAIELLRESNASAAPCLSAGEPLPARGYPWCAEWGEKVYHVMSAARSRGSPAVEAVAREVYEGASRSGWAPVSRAG